MTTLPTKLFNFVAEIKAIVKFCFHKLYNNEDML